MNSETIQLLDITDFANRKELTNYLTDNIVVTNQIENIPHLKNIPIRINFLCVITAIEGEMQIEVNNQSYTIASDDSLIMLPTMLIERIQVSDKHKIQAIGFSTRFVKRVLVGGHVEVLRNIYHNPVCKKNEFDKESNYKLYARIIMHKIAEPDNSPLKKEILDYLFSNILCEMVADLIQNRTLNNETNTEPDTTSYKRSAEIFRQFIQEVSTDNGLHRSLSYFADRLCYTPKYVSNIIKQASGRSALDWINEMALEHIKYQLKHSSKSMKEIADEFNFPNQSFFGKYFKSHVGMSPAKYREIGD